MIEPCSIHQSSATCNLTSSDGTYIIPRYCNHRHTQRSVNTRLPKTIQLSTPLRICLLHSPSNTIQPRGLVLIRHQTTSNMLNSIWRHSGINSMSPCLCQVSLSFRQIPTRTNCSTVTPLWGCQRIGPLGAPLRIHAPMGTS